MKHFLKHGNTIPTNKDLDNGQMGICLTNDKIYFNNNGNIVCLNDFDSIDSLEEGEIFTRKYIVQSKDDEPVSINTGCFYFTGTINSDNVTFNLIPLPKHSITSGLFVTNPAKMTSALTDGTLVLKGDFSECVELLVIVDNEICHLVKIFALAEFTEKRAMLVSIEKIKSNISLN